MGCLLKSTALLIVQVGNVRRIPTLRNKTKPLTGDGMGYIPKMGESWSFTFYFFLYQEWNSSSSAFVTLKMGQKEKYIKNTDNWKDYQTSTPLANIQQPHPLSFLCKGELTVSCLVIPSNCKACKIPCFLPATLCYYLYILRSLLFPEEQE